MQAKKIIAIAALAPLLFAGSAFAQSSTTTASTTTSATSTATTTPVVGPALAAQAEFVQRVFAGTTNAVLSIITLDATRSSQAVTVQAVPISVSASGGATLSTLSNCGLYSTTGVRLTTGANAVLTVTGSNIFRLDTPLSIPGGQGALLLVRCSVAQNAPAGGILTLGFTPSGFQATSASGTLTVSQGLQSNGLPGTNTRAILIAVPNSTGTPSSPGIPNTGLGGDAMLYLALLAFSALAVALGFRGVLMR